MEALCAEDPGRVAVLEAERLRTQMRLAADWCDYMDPRQAARVLRHALKEE